MANTFKVTVLLPTVSDPEEVVSREVTYFLDGVERGKEIIPEDQSQYVLTGLPQGSVLRVELRDIDESANVSEPAIREAQLIDTIPPDKPGELGFILEEEKS